MVSVEGLSLQLLWMIHHICFWITTLVVYSSYHLKSTRDSTIPCMLTCKIQVFALQICSTRVTWFQCLCISWNMDLSIRFVLRFLRLTRLPYLYLHTLFQVLRSIKTSICSTILNLLLIAHSGTPLVDISVRVDTTLSLISTDFSHQRSSILPFGYLTFWEG